MYILFLSTIFIRLNVWINSWFENFLWNINIFLFESSNCIHFMIELNLFLLMIARRCDCFLSMTLFLKYFHYRRKVTVINCCRIFVFILPLMINLPTLSCVFLHLWLIGLINPLEGQCTFYLWEWKKWYTSVRLICLLE